MTRHVFAAVLVCVLSASCKGGGSNASPTAPSGAGGTAPTEGAWTGTITRPGGLAPITVRWEATRDPAVDYRITGPMTLTNGGTSVTIRASGNTSGNDSNGYKISMSLTANTGEIAGFPTCNINGSHVGSQEGDPFPQPYTRISVPALDMSYNNCRGFIEYASPTNSSLTERTQLNLSK